MTSNAVRIVMRYPARGSRVIAADVHDWLQFAIPRKSRFRSHSAVLHRIFLASLIAASAASAEGQESTAEAARPGLPARTQVGVDYTTHNFFGDIAPWNLAAVSLGRRGERGTLIARVTAARRFQINGLQAELDAYPRLGPGRYAYLNAGYGSSRIFPRVRVGGELFTSLPRAWEASAGFRHLRFTGRPVTLFTGSVGRYVGNYWYSLRPYVRQKDEGTAASASLSVRRYYEDADNYVGVRIGYGSTPGDELDRSELDRANSAVLAVQGSHGLWKNTIGTWSMGVDRDELSPRVTRTGVVGSAGLRVTY